VRRTVIVALVAVGLLAGCFAVATWLGFRLAVGGSLPFGVYWFVGGAVQRGQVAEACLPVAIARYALEHNILWRGTGLMGGCPLAAAPVFKIVAAVAGDEVAVAPSGVRVNGRLWPMSAVRPIDGPRVRVGSYRVQPGYVWLLGWNPQSFDSRYFSAVPVASIRGRVIPVATSAGFFWTPALGGA
jgi:conjugative transfer signal peptidase TraF